LPYRPAWALAIPACLRPYRPARAQAVPARLGSGHTGLPGLRPYRPAWAQAIPARLGSGRTGLPAPCALIITIYGLLGAAPAQNQFPFRPACCWLAGRALDRALKDENSICLNKSKLQGIFTYLLYHQDLYLVLGREKITLVISLGAGNSTSLAWCQGQHLHQPQHQHQHLGTRASNGCMWPPAHARTVLVLEPVLASIAPEPAWIWC